jgi:hypothetical protein
MTSDLVLQATERGKKLFSDADIAFRDAGIVQGFGIWEEKIIAIVESVDGLMDVQTLALLKQLLSIGQEAEHPNRLAYFKTETIRNLVLVLGGVAISGSALVLAVPHLWPLLVALIAADKIVGGGIAQSDVAKVAKKAIGNGTNKIFDEVLLKHTKTWMGYAKGNSDRKWLEDLIEMLKREKEKRDQ